MSSIWTIRRSATDSKLTGLCGGIAQHWGVDPVLVRVGCALLALSGGIGIVLYLAGWLLIPMDGKDRSPVDDLLGPQARRWPREVWIVIVVVACVATLAIFGSVIPFGFGPAVILAAIWYFGYYKNRPPRPDPPADRPDGSTTAVAPQEPTQFVEYPGPATPFTEAARAWQQRIAENERAAGGIPPAWQAASARQPEPQAGSSQAAAPEQASPSEQGDPPEPARPPQQTAAASSWPTTGWQAASRPNEQDPTPTEPMGPADSLPASNPMAEQAFLATPDPVGLYSEPVPDTVEAPKPIKGWQRKSAKRLRLVSLIVLGLTLSGLGIADALGVSIAMATYFAAALLVIGLTLVAAAWHGRPRGLLLVGFIALLGVVTTTVSGPLAAQRGWGEEQLTYSSSTALPTVADHREVGSLTVDLSQLELTQDATYAAGVEYGRLEVKVPDDANVRVQYAVESGIYQGADLDEQAGSDLGGVTNIPTTPDPKKPTLTLDLTVERGQLEVHR